MKRVCTAGGGRRRQRGLAMVEFVVSVPVVLLLMFGSFEFGHVMIQYVALNDTVRDAARYVAGQVLQGTADNMCTGSCFSTLASQGQNLAVYGVIAGTPAAGPLLPSLNSTDIAITEDTVNRNITVVATYPYIPMFGATIPDFFKGGGISTAFTLSITTTMRAL